MNMLSISDHTDILNQMEARALFGGHNYRVVACICCMIHIDTPIIPFSLHLTVGVSLLASRFIHQNP